MQRQHIKIIAISLVCSLIYMYLYSNVSNEKRIENRCNVDCYGVNIKDALNSVSYLFYRESCKSNEGGKKITENVPLITLFTTWNSSKENYARRNNTLNNWAQMTPDVIPLLFTNDNELRREVKQKGWETRPVSKLGIGTPVLKYMYLEAMRQFHSTFYAYANGDILFTDKLVSTLHSVSRNETLLNHTILIIGQRTNVKYVTEEEAINFALLKNASKARGELFTPWAVDYFITNKNFPWPDMPDVVVGRRAYDNFLILESIKQKFVVIDAIKTIPAIHHSINAGNFEHRKKTNLDYNAVLISKYYKKTVFSYSKGQVICANYYSESLTNGTIIVRKKMRPAC